MEGLRLVSRQFRKQRLAVWAAGRGPWFFGSARPSPAGDFTVQKATVWAAGREPDPHFTAMVFWLCETVL